MIFQNQFSAVASFALIALHLATAPSHAANLNQPSDSERFPELINHPVCRSADEPDPSRHCDFAQRD
jgi:hypothetical protein